MFPLPFTATEYGAAIVAEVVSIELMLWTLVAPAVIGVIFSIFIYQTTRKVSALYLLLASIVFACWSYFDFITWGAPAKAIMFSWSLLDIFSTLFCILGFWFLYAFVTKKDVPFGLKLISLVAFIPPAIYTLMSWNMSTYSNAYIEALENDLTANLAIVIQSLIMLSAILFSAHMYKKSTNSKEKTKIALAGLGVFLFIFFFVISYTIVNLLLQYTVLSSITIYSFEFYSLLGMPFLVGFLGYLIAKYEAFDMKLTKSIGLIVILMFLLFVNIFI
jgi:hypothetical protein